MDHIKNIVNEIIKSSSPQTGWKNNIIQNWQEIIGPLAHKIFIEKIHQDIIVLGVTDSCWMQELHMLSNMIKNKINQALDTPRIQHIQFKYSSKKIARIRKQNNPTLAPITLKPLTQEEEEALTHIKDPELSQALSRFLQKCHQF